MKWGDMVHGCIVYTERAETAAVPGGTSHVSTKQHRKSTTSVNIQNVKIRARACARTHTHTHTHAHTHTSTHAHTCAHTHTHTRARAHTCAHTHTHARARARTRTHMCARMREIESTLDRQTDGERGKYAVKQNEITRHLDLDLNEHENSS